MTLLDKYVRKQAADIRKNEFIFFQQFLFFQNSFFIQLVIFSYFLIRNFFLCFSQVLPIYLYLVIVFFVFEFDFHEFIANHFLLFCMSQPIFPVRNRLLPHHTHTYRNFPRLSRKVESSIPSNQIEVQYHFLNFTRISFRSIYLFPI